jgi:hypothetical protein
MFVFCCNGIPKFGVLGRLPVAPNVAPVPRVNEPVTALRMPVHDWKQVLAKMTVRSSSRFRMSAALTRKHCGPAAL